MIDTNVNDNLLSIDGNTVRFDTDIFEVEEFDDFAVVLLEWVDNDSSDRTRNVYAIDSDGSVRWKIDECPDVVGGKHSAYGGLHVMDGELWATTVVGISYRIDTNTGEVLEKRIVK